MMQAEKKNEGDVNHVDLDSILVQEVGQFGVYQLRTILLTAIIVIFMAWHAEYVFTVARTPTRCFIEECDSDEAIFEPQWLSVAIPPDGTGFDNCARYGNRTAVPADSVPDDTCPAELFDTTVTRPCERYVHSDTYSAVVDLGLECDEWRRTLIGTVRTLGTIPVLPLTGYVSDRWGRRTALVLNGFNTAWLGLLRYWSNTYPGFLISQFVEAALGAGGFSSAYILATELVGPKYRVAAGATMSSCFALGQVFLGWIARAVRPWRTLTLVLYLPQLITLAYFWIIAESIRWLLSKGRYDEATKMLGSAAATNGKRLSDEAVAKLQAAGERESIEAEARKAERARAPWLPVLVFRSRPVLLRCIVSPFWWISTTFIYYGLSINAVDLAGDGYYNFMLVSAIEIPGFWTAVFLLDRMGRRPVLMLALWMCAACQLGYIFLPENLWGISLTLYLIGKYCISIVVTSVYVYTAELYPTIYRHRLFAFSSMIGRLGSITAPLTPALAQTIWSGLPFALFGACAFLSGCLILLTPETRGTRLPDTMHEAEMLGKETPTFSTQNKDEVNS